eukprot:Clim_evm28s240 gene=Clim_evmTU28s240
MAHIDAGKTTLTERLLFYSGTVDNVGEVHDGNTITDYMEQERERGITITSAAVSFPWRDSRINLIDTPGHVDFTFEVERSLRVLDGAVAVYDGVAGVEAQSHTVWRQANRYRLPRLVFVNKMDRVGADFGKCVREIREKLQGNPLVCTYPLNEGDHFKEIMDVVNLQKLTYTNDGDGKEFAVTNFATLGRSDPKLAEGLLVRREELCEALADADSAFAETWLDVDGSPLMIDTEVIKESLRKTTRLGRVQPTFAGSAYKNKGVQPLLDAVVDFLPPPHFSIDHSSVRGGKNAGKHVPVAQQPLHAYVFKLIHSPQRGPLAFIRIYSGTIKAGMQLWNVNHRLEDRVINLLEPFADELRLIKSSTAGHIVVGVGIKGANTGDTLVDANAAKGSAVEELPVVRPPPPVFICTIEPERSSDVEDLKEALIKLQREDPSFHVDFEASGAIELKGMGELHLEILRDRIEREYNIQTELGSIEVSYKERPLTNANVSFELDRLIGGRQCRGAIELTIKRREVGDELGANEEEDSPKKKALAPVVLDLDTKPLMKRGLSMSETVRLLNEGFENACLSGPDMGFPIVDTSVHVKGLELHRDSPPATVTYLARDAITEAIRRAGSETLEPVMSLEMSMDPTYLGDVLTDLTSQREGEVKEMQEGTGQMRQLRALVPLKNMIGYSTVFRALSKGHGSYTMEFHSYRQLSQAQKEALRTEYGGLGTF